MEQIVESKRDIMAEIKELEADMDKSPPSFYMRQAFVWNHKKYSLTLQRWTAHEYSTESIAPI